MRVFWKHGYEGSSLPKLTEAMGINRPSLYAAFGNKESLFRKSINRYLERPGAFFKEALEQPKARLVAERLLGGAIETYSGPRHPKGCLTIHGALVCSADSESIRKELVALRTASEKLIRERFERAMAEHDLPSNASPADLARFVTAVMAGMSVQSTSGVGRAELKQVARMAMQAWPD